MQHTMHPNYTITLIYPLGRDKRIGVIMTPVIHIYINEYIHIYITGSYIGVIHYTYK